jgi:hypothetical protein
MKVGDLIMIKTQGLSIKMGDLVVGKIGIIVGFAPWGDVYCVINGKRMGFVPRYIKVINEKG